MPGHTHTKGPIRRGLVLRLSPSFFFFFGFLLCYSATLIAYTDGLKGGEEDGVVRCTGSVFCPNKDAQEPLNKAPCVNELIGLSQLFFFFFLWGGAGTCEEHRRTAAEEALCSSRHFVPWKGEGGMRSSLSTAHRARQQGRRKEGKNEVVVQRQR
jgi:hypothetical protein